jgi:DNA-directed RNA polymerase III subunit RPC1
VVKAVNDKCKKVVHCPYCEGTNGESISALRPSTFVVDKILTDQGLTLVLYMLFRLLGTVKKVGALRIVHEKYRAKKVAEEYEQFKNTFNNALEAVPEMKAHISKAQEDMNPLRVLNLFKAISDEVSKLNVACRS